MRICVEEHWMPQTGPDKMPRLPPSVNPEAFPNAMKRLSDLELRLSLMDESDITMQVLAPAMPFSKDKKEAIVGCQRINDALAGIVQEYPDRFAGYALLPLVDLKAATDELARGATQLGLRRAILISNVGGEYLDEPKFRPLWERAEELGTPIYLHPFDPPTEATKSYKGHPELLGPSWSWTVDAATAVLRIIGGGVFDTFPRSVLVLGHLGEGLPYLLGRLNEGYAAAFKTRRLKKPFSDYLKENIVITTSGKYNPEALICAISALGSDRVLFAADYPFVTPREAVELIEGTPLNNSDKEKIYHLNARRWLRL